MPKLSEAPVSVPKYLLEDNLTQECRDFMSSLPEGRGWLENSVYQYKGFWHSSKHVPGIFNLQKHFQARNGDIILATKPKTGTTWLKALSFALLNREKFQISQDQHPLLTNNSHILVPCLEMDLFNQPQIPDLTNMPSPRLFSTHLPHVSLPESVNGSSCRIVYCCRDPKDALVSLWHFMNKLRLEEMGSISIEDAVDKFCKGVSPSGPFWDHVLGYWKKSLENPDKVLFMRYEEMKQQPVVQLKRVANFLDCPFSEKEEASGVVDEILKLCSFDTLSNLEVTKIGKTPTDMDFTTFFRKGIVGDWSNYLTAEMGEKAGRFGFEVLEAFVLLYSVFSPVMCLLSRPDHFECCVLVFSLDSNNAQTLNFCAIIQIKLLHILYPSYIR